MKNRLYFLSKVFALLFLFLFTQELSAQNRLSVSFDYGAIGTIGSNPQQANSITNFQTLQLTKAYFIQVSNGTQFSIQGNDIPGTLRLVTVANKYVDISGAIVWRENGNPTTYVGFIPSASLNSFNLSTYGGASYSISNTSNFIIRFNNTNTAFTNNANINGNAAMTSVLEQLNLYLSSSIASSPTGPVTVNSLTTTNTTPTISGSVTLRQGESLTVEVNGTVYSTNTGLTVNGNTWSLPIPGTAGLTAGNTYPVSAVITNTSGFTLIDNTTNELIISEVPTVTISAVNASNATVASGATTNDAALTLTFTTSQTTTNFQEADVTVSGAVLSNFSGTGTTYTATLTPSANSGTVNVSVAANRFTNSFDLGNTASSVFVWNYDIQPPAITISAKNSAGVIRSSGSTTNDNNLELTFSISENTSNFTSSDVTVSNGTLSSFAGSGNTYTAILTPTAAGQVTVTVPAGVFTDAVSNNNLASGAYIWNYATTRGVDDSRTSVTFLENTVNADAQLLFPTNTTRYYTTSSSFSGRSLSLTYASGGGTQDRLSIKDEGTGSGQLNVSASQTQAQRYSIKVGNTEIGTYPSSLTGSGINGEHLTITLTASATAEFINKIVNNFTYFNSSNSPTLSRTIRLTIGDPSGTLTKDLIVNVTAENDAPNIGRVDSTIMDITMPGDQISQVPVGSGSPGSEQVPNSIDNSVATKYLNFSGANSGLMVIPSAGPSLVTQLTFTTANDVPNRDPITYKLEGSKDDGQTFTTIVQSAATNITPQTGRFTKVVAAQFDNKEWYNAYRLTFPTLILQSDVMQIGEVELLGKPLFRLYYAMGGTPISVYNILPMVDPDNDNILEARVRISQNFTPGDSLFWTIPSGSGISGSYDRQTGIATFTGTSSVANYKALLRSVKFQATANNVGKERIVKFRVTDVYGANSEEVQSTIVVSFAPTLNSVNKLSNKYLNYNNKITYTDLKNAAQNFNDQDPEDPPNLKFKVTAVGQNGSLLLNATTALTTGNEIGPNDYLIWQPAAAGQDISLFSVKAFDGSLESPQAVPVTVDVLNSVPTLSITRSGDLNSFASYVQNYSCVQNITVDGTYLTGDITVTPPAGFEISTSANSGFSSNPIVLTQTLGLVNAQKIYIRTNNTNPLGSITGNLELSSPNANSLMISLGGIVENPVTPTVTISSSDQDNVVCNRTSVTFTATATSITGTPTYKWYLNGALVSGVSGNTYTTTTLVNNDAVYATVDNSDRCVVLTSNNSNTITTTVDALPSVAGITGPSSVYIQNNISLSSTTSGGLWSSTNTEIATINANSGVVTGVGEGIVTVRYSYTDPTTQCTNSVTTSIIVNSLPPTSLSYTTPNVYQRETTISNLTPLVRGGTPTSYSVSPALPAGLTINTISGVISGTPRVVSGATNYTVTASNKAGSVSAVVNIRVNEVPPLGLSYTTPNSYVKGTAINQLTPVLQRGPVTSYTISPSLPTGLSINSSTGIISGTPTVASNTRTYTVTASNNGGSTTANLEITITDIPPQSLIYQSPNVYRKGTAISALTPTVTGGTPTSYTISPALPTGLVLDTTTGSISGTPTVVSPATTYTITAINSGGSVSANTVITVNDVAPSGLAYTTPNIFRKGVAITALTPTVSGGTVVSYSISPALPNGLTLNTSNGTISGTSTVISSTRTYTVTATNTGGSTTANLVITVNDIAPSNLSYNTPNTFYKNAQILSLTPTVSGGTVVSYSISPSLPSGLTMNSSTGVISGTPSSISSATTYTVTATNTGGSVNTTLSIRVLNEPPQSLRYNPSTQTVLRTDPIVNMLPIVTGGGGITQYTISPALPNGLTINPTTGIISGTLLETVAGTKQFTISATDGGTIISANITLIFNSAPTDIGLSASSIAENNAANAVVGTLSTTDPDAGDTHTYTLVSGSGDTDNSLFNISNNSLRVNTGLDFETKSTYSIRIRTTDAGGLSYEKVFTITVTNVDEDRDGDGILDSQELLDGTDPLNSCSFKLSSQTLTPSTAWQSADCDNDGLTNQREKDLGTDPLKGDTDGDGVLDGKEVDDKTDPKNLCSLKLESQTITPSNAWLAGDCNGDGIKNGQNLIIVMYGTKPQLQADGTFKIQYVTSIRNLRPETVTLNTVQQNFATVFTSPATFRITTIRSSGRLNLVPGYDGRTQINLINNTSTLAGYTKDSVVVELVVSPNGFSGSVNAQAVLTGTGAFSLPINTNSTDTTVSNGFIPTNGLPVTTTIPQVGYVIPDAFSPNRDGMNDLFVIVRPYQTTISLEVFNRWGNVIYRNGNYNNDWDGRAMSQYGGGDLPPGTYYYIITAKEKGGEVRQFKGFITLKR